MHTLITKVPLMISMCQLNLQKVPCNRPKNYFIQSSAILKWYNFTRYYKKIYRNLGRISIRCWIHNKTPYLALMGKLWGVLLPFVSMCEKIKGATLCIIIIKIQSISIDIYLVRWWLCFIQYIIQNKRFSWSMYQCSPGWTSLALGQW